jgi:hypothetical protein
LRWLPELGLDPSKWDIHAARRIIVDQDPIRSRSSVLLSATVMRSFLRHMASEGRWSPALAAAVPPAPRQRLSTLPRPVPAEVIERVIASCDGVLLPRRAKKGCRNIKNNRTCSDVIRRQSGDVASRGGCK